MQDIGIINKGVNEISRNTTFGEWLALGSNKTLTIIVNKFALLWGEAQLCLPYVCLLGYDFVTNPAGSSKIL